jgi:hypothetical protein
VELFPGRDHFCLINLGDPAVAADDLTRDEDPVEPAAGGLGPELLDQSDLQGGSSPDHDPPRAENQDAQSPSIDRPRTAKVIRE